MFRLRMPPRYRALHPVFYASKLTQYSESTIRGQKATPPPPTLIQGPGRMGGRKNSGLMTKAWEE